MNEQPKYDEQRRSRAGTTAAFRALAAAYLLYLGVTLIRDTLRGGGTMPVWMGLAAGVFFALAGAAFALYAWRRYRGERDAARLPSEETGTEEE